MNILLTGGTGFVGSFLIQALSEKSHHIYNVTRSPEAFQNNDTTTFIGYDQPVHELPDIHAVINLAGESLFGYWTNQKKESILRSRIETTETIVQMMADMETKPNVFVSGSAVGYYGTSDDMIFTEDTTQSGNDFLADVVVQWEKTAKRAEKLDIRSVYARFGLILGTEGALPLMSLPVKLFVGGKVGNGEQWISWIHIDDVVRLIIHCIENEQISGPINFTTPNPHRNKDFMKVLANVLKRPFYFPTPSFLMRLAMGEMSELMTKGQFVLPKRAEENNFTYSFPKLEDALRETFKK